MTSCNKSGGVQCDKRKKKIESALVFQTSFHSSFYFSFFSRLQPSPFSASTCCTFCLLSTTMVVSVDVRKLIVKWHNEGLSNRAIAKLIDHDTTTVGNILKQFKTEGSLVPHHSSGRPRELSEREERHAARLLKTEHGIPATAIAAELSEAHGKKINPNAVRRSLHRQGFFNAKMAVKPKLTKRGAWSLRANTPKCPPTFGAPSSSRTSLPSTCTVSGGGSTSGEELGKDWRTRW